MAVGSTKAVAQKSVLGVTEHGLAVEKGLKALGQAARAVTPSKPAASSGASQFVDSKAVAGKLLAQVGQQVRSSASRFGAAPAAAAKSHAFAEARADSRRAPEAKHYAMAAALANLPADVAADVLGRLIGEIGLERDSRGQFA